MSYLQIILLSIALAMDAMAVAAANGAHHHKMSFFKALYIAGFFGFFQFFMPLVGWFLGQGVQNIFMQLDHWVAFVLLGGIGTRMIVESFKTVKERNIDVKNLYILLLLSVATSIDALVVGISFAFVDVHIIASSLLIGLITFMLSLASIYIGKKLGEVWGKKSEVIGGIVLICIGLKILFTHLF